MVSFCLPHSNSAKLSDVCAPHNSILIGQFAEDKDDEDRRLYHAEKKERKLSSVVPSGPTKHGVYELTRGQEEKPYHLNRNVTATVQHLFFGMFSCDLFFRRDS